MKKISFIIATTALIPLHLFAQTVPLPQLLNFDGQLLDSSNNPIASTVPVVFEIFDGSGTPYCLLYKETQSVTPNAIGEFSVKIGPDTGNASPADDGDLLWPAIFSNNGQVRPHNTMFCNTGYTPAAGHARKLRVTVNGFQLTPDFTIAPVPMATVAETLQGKVANDFLLATPPAANANTSVLTGNLRLSNNFGLQLTNSASTNFVTLRSPAGLSADYSLLLPTDDGSNGQVLSTDGNGVLSWIAPGGGVAVSSVFGRTGAVVQQSGDYNASQITSAATGSITATNVQNAIAQLESQKISVGAMLNGTMITDGSITGVDLAASTVLDSHLTNVSINKLASGAGQYLTYTPGGTACANNQILRWDLTNWVCHTIPAALPIQASNAGRFLITDGSSATWSPNLIQDGAGNVGIGTSSPAFLLHLLSASAHQSIESTSTSQPGRLMISSPKNSTNMSVGEIIFQNTSNANIFAAIKGLTDPSGIANGALVFSTGTGSPTERVRINTAGSMGIGISTPETRLDVNGTIMSRPYGVAAGEGGRILMRELAGNGINFAGIRAPDAMPADYVLTLPASPGSTGQLLQTDGAGMLSWTTPIFLPPADSLDFVHFSDTMTLDATTEILASGTNALSITNTGTGDSFKVNDGAADTSPFVVAANGDVGIGVGVPLAKLDVAGPVKLGIGGTAFQASGVCSIVISTHGAGSEATPQFCAGVPNITTVAVHCSPSAPVAGYITARATGSSDMIAATLGVSGGPTTLTCMWMVP